MKHLLLIDASGFAHRAFYAGPAFYRESDGMPTWAITGFLSLTWRLLGEAEVSKPTHGAAVFDHPSKTFRHKLYPAYKSKRNKSEELTAQLPFMRDAAETLGLTSVEAKGYEADDVIATLAYRGLAEGYRVTIVSSDKDFGQLIRDEEIEIVDPLMRRRVRAADVQKKFGVAPSHLADFQALAGDAIDGIPGIKGIGEKRAAAIVRQFGTVDEILNHIDEVPLPARVHIKRQRKELRVFKRLTTLDRGVRGLPQIGAFTLKQVQRRHLEELLKALEAGPRFSAIFGGDAVLARLIPKAIGDPLAWWKSAISKRHAKRLPDIPQCGFYQRRLVKGGVMVPARIWREPDADFGTGKPNGHDVLLCEVGGKREDAYTQWGWLCTQPIPEREYNHLVKLGGWARQYAPDDPFANPKKPVDFLSAPLPEFSKRGVRR